MGEVLCYWFLFVGRLCYSSKTLLYNDPAHWVDAAKRLSATVVILLYVSIFFDAVNAVAVTVLVPSAATDPLSTDDALIALLALVGLVGLVLTAVFYCMWVFRTIKAAMALSPKPFPTSAGMAVGYYFIPILSLYRPYQIMRQTFEWSMPQKEKLSSKTSALMLTWWLLWIFGNLIGYSAVRADNVPLDVLSSFLSVLAGLGLIPLVKELSEIQTRRLKEWQEAQAPFAAEGFVDYPRQPGPPPSM
jgi:hypothetical protein